MSELLDFLYNWGPTFLPFISLMMVLISGYKIIVLVDAKDELKWVILLVVFSSFLIIGFMPANALRWINGASKIVRLPNVAQVQWPKAVAAVPTSTPPMPATLGNVITFPPVLEEGARWVVVDDKGNREFVQNSRYVLSDASLKKVKVHIMYSDGTTTGYSIVSQEP